MKEGNNSNSEHSGNCQEQVERADSSVYFSLDDLLPVTDFCRNVKLYTGAVEKRGRQYVLTSNGRPICRVVPLSALQNGTDY